MKNRLTKLIKEEDKRKPYTDGQLASMLGIRRDEVTNTRGELKIPDSRERRKPILLSSMKEITLKNSNITDRDLTEKLNNLGFDVSRFLINQLKKELLGNEPSFLGSKPIEKKTIKTERNHAFSAAASSSAKTD